MNVKKYIAWMVCGIMLITGCSLSKVNSRPLETEQISIDTTVNEGQIGYGIYDNPPLFNIPLTKLIKIEEQDKLDVDLRWKDMSSIDLVGKENMLVLAMFNTLTKWPSKLPSAFNPGKVLELGKSPGLHIRGRLHEKGITGKGVSIAAIDQPLNTQHKEYRDRIKYYETQKEFKGEEASMSGSATASMICGENTGIAPEANLYYIGSRPGKFVNDSFEEDYTYFARAIEQIVMINKTLLKEEKIRAVAISKGFTPGYPGYEAYINARKKAVQDGIFVITCSMQEPQEYSFKFHGAGRMPMDSPEEIESYTAGAWWQDNISRLEEDRILFPMDSKTLAGFSKGEDYTFYRVGGWGNCTSYIAGLYALACQVAPDVTPEIFWRCTFETANEIILQEQENHIQVKTKLVNPTKLIETLSKK